MYDSIAMPGFPLTLKSSPFSLVQFVCARVRMCLFLLVTVWTLSRQLSPPGPGSYNRNNEQLFCSDAANQTRFTKKDSGGQGWALSHRGRTPSTHVHSAHTSSWLPLFSHASLVFRGSPWQRCPPRENGWDAVMGSWPSRSSIYKIWWLFQRKISSCVVETRDRWEENPSNGTWWIYTPEIFTVYGLCLCVIARLLHVPVDHPDCIWLCSVCVCVHVCLYVYVCVPWALPVVKSMQQRWFMTFSVVSERENSHYKCVSFQHSVTLIDVHTHTHTHTLALLCSSVPTPTRIDKNECIFVYANWHKWTKNILNMHSFRTSSD